MKKSFLIYILLLTTSSIFGMMGPSLKRSMATSIRFGKGLEYWLSQPVEDKGVSGVSVEDRNLSVEDEGLVVLPVRFVPEGHVYLKETFGKFQESKQPGISFFLPFVHSIKQVNMQEIVDGINSQEVITKDNASVTADGVYYYRITDPIKAAYEVNDLDVSIRQLVMTALRSVLGNLTLDEALSGREQIKNAVLKQIAPTIAKWGTDLLKVEVREIMTSDALKEDMNKQMIAERQRRETILHADGQLEAAKRQAEGIKITSDANAYGIKVTSDANAYEIKVTSDAHAYQREKNAQAEANAIEMVNKVIQSSSNGANYLLKNNSIKQWGKVASGPSTKILAAPTDSLIGLSNIMNLSELWNSQKQQPK